MRDPGPGAGTDLDMAPVTSSTVSRTWYPIPTTSRHPRTYKRWLCTTWDALRKKTAWPVQHIGRMSETMTTGYCYDFLREWKTKGRLTSYRAAPATPGSGTAATNITTAWMNSATTTCWMPAHRGEWPRATKQASVWRTLPVIMGTTDDLPVLHTHRGWVLDVMILMQQT